MLNKLNIFLIIALGIVLWLYFAKEKTIKEVTKTKIEFIQETSKLQNIKPKNIKLITIKVPIKQPFETKVTDTIWKEKEVKEYTYRDSLSNGILESTIIADNIYNRNIKLTTFNKKITTKTVKTVVRSDLYFGSVITLDNSKSISNVSVNAFYTHKGRFLLNYGIGYEIKYNNPTFNIGVGFKF